MIVKRLFQAVLAVVVLVCQVQALAGQRVALLIGNAKYGNAPLRNPPNDVQQLDAALKALGFQTKTVLDANQSQMKRAVRDFGTLAQGADVAVLYYSGHGTQASGENYLIPLQATIEKESDYEVEAVSVNALMRQIGAARPKAAIVVLDACRDNPFASVTKSATKGLGRMEAPTGTMIAFATAPNTTAGDEGHYARVLATQLRTPGLELLDVFRNTTAEVRRLTGGRQEPRLSEVSITDRIYLSGQVPPRPEPGQTVAVVRPDPAPRPPVTAPAEGQSEWSGSWEGTYRYGGGSGQAPVKFQLDATVRNGRLSGQLSEPNTFGDKSAAVLYAVVVGTVDGTSVRFTKRYDGSGGASHEVLYEGRLDRNAQTVRGQWRIQDVSGPFEMKLKPQ
jgi:hypothetical protein